VRFLGCSLYSIICRVMSILVVVLLISLIFLNWLSICLVIVLFVLC